MKNKWKHGTEQIFRIFILINTPQLERLTNFFEFIKFKIRVCLFDMDLFMTISHSLNNF
jgi:hypothetical protein